MKKTKTRCIRSNYSTILKRENRSRRRRRTVEPDLPGRRREVRPVPRVQHDDNTIGLRRALLFAARLSAIGNVLRPRRMEHAAGDRSPMSPGQTGQTGSGDDLEDVFSLKTAEMADGHLQQLESLQKKYGCECRRWPIIWKNDS